ncbi:glycosyltransferase N-terminal domain-containing protein [Cognatishimia sp. SS12]|uniref:3-deoxy-D-manno-octulosonic acid transferase n=1 Tax=Cognatishimia sp. SS12 TaxID=2979465 RepID=UPI00232FAD9E|nr:glycosyltransferase N-terminal domain-containing protein [Cognatishimia sp. SS12]MDC0737906.1 glycosyltransferase N-terminal domain-containing protein [Cognatishimia sp. SS12]
MAPTLSLTAYLAIARREAQGWHPPERARSAVPMIWIHCADTRRARAMAHLGLRLAAQRGDAQVLLTVPARTRNLPGLPDGVTLTSAPGENPNDIGKFLDYWHPEVLIYLGPDVRPALTLKAHQRGIPLFLIDADELRLELRSARWLPDTLRATLSLFTHIFARDAACGFRLRRMLGTLAPVSDSGPVLDESPALGCNETDLEELNSSLRARPLWLAAHVQPQELPIILMAHRATMRLSPRLLLILVPDSAADAAAMRDECKDASWRVRNWDDAEMPEERTQILLAENREELGLFYRVAPISLMGSSLVPGKGGRNPLEPAALGSAILYGPGIRNHLDAYSRLARAGAARIVKDADSLSAALANLMAPDQVAQMVHAGWESVSEGAVVVDHIVDVISDHLDKTGGR